MTYTRSTKEEVLNEKILASLTSCPKALKLAQALIADEETRVLQEYANTVAIKRLGFNDHGPVHMRQAALNAIRLVSLLAESGVPFSLEHEGAGSAEDSLCAILLASFLHDSGMTICRSLHEQTALILAKPIIDRLLEAVYGADAQKYIVRSLALEGILGHMAITPIHSREAGVILVADGCDMQKGRARIPMILQHESREGHAGDIHKYSADAIEKVSIGKGEEKPIKIMVEMNASIGFFQIEEVLLPKINKSPIKPFIELYAHAGSDEIKRYL